MSLYSADTSQLFPWYELVAACKSDARIEFLVDRKSLDGTNVRQLVDWRAVLTESDQDRAFADATSLESYAAFAKRAYSYTVASTELDDLTGTFNWRAFRWFLTTKPTMVLVAGLLILLLTLPDHLAIAGQVTAVLLAPAAGLTWRRGATAPSIPLRMLASVLCLLGIGILVTPFLLGFRYSYLPWFLLFLFLGVVWIFSLDHAKRPLIRDFKFILLRPDNYGRDRRANEARRAWLRDALENAVMPEVVQTINRLLGPEQEKRLLVHDANGLRAIYHKDSQVSTLAARRLEEALRRSDGASIAVSGPRGCGKTNLLKELRTPESRFSVLVSAPTQYAPKEFLIELFQELCTEYIKDQKFPVESDGSRAKGAVLVQVLHSMPVRVLRVAVSAALFGLFIWDLTARKSNRQMERFTHLPISLWTDKSVFIAIILAALILLIFPKSIWHDPPRRREPELVMQARGYLRHLQAEQTATLQVGGSLPVMQAAFSKAIALRSLQWTMPELVAHLQEFLIEVAMAMAQTNRMVLICIDEVDRIGSAEEATKFLSEIKAIFGVPDCYFVVAVAEELGVTLSRSGISGRSVADNAFDEIISLEPMSFELSRELLTRRVPGFTDSFVWLSLVLSGGLPRNLIRVARRLVELTIESEYELRLPEFAQLIIREEIYEAAVSTRGQIAQLSPGEEWGPIIDRLRQRIRDAEPTAKPSDLLAALKRIAELPAEFPPTNASEASQIKDATNKLVALALLGLTTCDVFRDDCFNVVKLLDSTADAPGPYAELAAARRELSISAESCRTTVERIRLSLNLDEDVAGK